MNKNGSKIFVKWQSKRDNPNAVLGECMFNKTLPAELYSDYDTKLKYICSDNINKLILEIWIKILLGTNPNF